jgi:hypothetical protein
MMSALNHSPTPWRADKEIVEDANGWAVADCEFIGYTTVASENAALICRAVNSHADLLAALKMMLKPWDGFSDNELQRRGSLGYFGDERAVDGIIRARAALAKAEAGGGEMFVRIWNARDCILELAWRTAAQVRRLKPLTLAATLACGPGAGPPPPVAHVPPVLTPPSWVPPVMPPPWSYVPPDTSYPPIEIPTGPVVPLPSGPQETFAPDVRRFLTTEELKLPRLCPPTEVVTVPMPPGVTTSPAPEPAPLAIVGVGLLGMALMKRKRLCR